MDARLFEAFADGLIPIIARHCARAVDDAVTPLLKRIAELEGRKPESIQLDFGMISQVIAEEIAKIPPAVDGKSVTVDDVRPMLQELVAALPKPEDGKSIEPADVRLMVAEEVAKIPPASDGKSVTLEDVAPLIVEEITKQVATIPVPKDGADGRDGIDGKDGASVGIEDVAPLIVEEITKQVATIPVPKDGAAGRDGIDGKDGASVTVDDVVPLIYEEVTKAVATIPVPKDGEPGVPGEKGDPGRDGRDASDIPMLRGFIAEQVAATFGEAFKTFAFSTPDDGRTLAFAAEFNGVSIHHEIKTGLVLDNGVWRPELFKKGDGVSFGGSFFIAQKDTADKPETSKSWRLAVKRGRDGRDGKPGERGLPGLKGERGEPGPRGYGG